MEPTDTKELIENSENLRTTYLGTRESQMGVEENVGIDDENRRLHVLNIGPTGSGKTQMMVHAALQDLQKDHGICLVVPKGDAVDQVLEKLPEDRTEDVVYINPKEEPVTPVNVLEPYITEEMSRAEMENQKEIIVADLLSLFKRQSENWGDQFSRILETLLRAHLDLNINYGESNTLLDVFQCVTDHEQLSQLIDRTEDPVLQNHLVSIREDVSDYELLPLQRRINDFVANPTIRRVIASEESGVDFRSVLQDNKIVLVEIQKGEIGKTAAQIIGSIVLTKVWAAAQSRIALPEEKRDPFHVYVDETDTFASEGSNFAQILSEAREYGLGFWLASQYLNQLDTDMRRAVTNNCRTKIFFNPSGSEDVSAIAGMLRGVGKESLKGLGRFRAVMQQPSTEEYNGAVTFDTFPPWTVDDVDIEERKRLAMAKTAGDSFEVKVKQSLGPAGNAGEQKHQDLLTRAKEYLESRPAVSQVNMLYQEPGEEKPDGHVIKDGGGVANLEAEHTTLTKPVKVLQNVKRAVDNGRKIVFVVEQGNETKLENILTDPVNRRGDEHEDTQGSYSYYTDDAGEPFTDVEAIDEDQYRILAVDGDTVTDHAKQAEAVCPELNPPATTEDDLQAFCMFRDDDGWCDALEQPCVLQNDGQEVPADD